MISRKSILAIFACGLLAIGLAACGDDDDSSAGNGGGNGQAEQQETETTPSADALKDTTTKPVIPKPTGTPPRKLVKEEIVKGTGPGAKPGDTVTVQYVGVNFSNGQEFDASWDSGATFPCLLYTSPSPRDLSTSRMPSSA